MSSLFPWRRSLILLLIILALGEVLFLRSMGRGLNHDEHQFIAPGVLISREGLMPYRDFAIFHLPNLAFAYAGMERLTHQPVFGAKLLSVLASTITGAAILLVAASDTLRRHRIALGAGLLLLFLADPLATFTSGKTWNHEVPACFLVLAIVAQARGISSDRWGWFAISGAAAGLAVGTRLTYLPAGAALGAALLLAPMPWRRRVAMGAIWSGACLVACAPSLYFFLTERTRFLQDNFTFPRLRLEDLTDTRAQKTIAPWRKVRYFAKEILPRSLVLIVALGGLCWLHAKTALGRWSTPGMTLVLLVLPFALLGAGLPSRYQYQHYYVLVPLVALGCAYASRAVLPTWGVASLSGLVALAMVSPWLSDAGGNPGGVRAYVGIFKRLHRSEWFPTNLRADYAATRLDAPVLTLAPAGVLEAGGRIYPEFATGPFGWRGSKLLPGKDREALHLVAPDDLPDLLGDRPPIGIVTGEEPELEKPFLDYARANHYQPQKMPRKRILWRRPVEEGD